MSPTWARPGLRLTGGRRPDKINTAGGGGGGSVWLVEESVVSYVWNITRALQAGAAGAGDNGRGVQQQRRPRGGDGAAGAAGGAAAR
eukprot:716403-Prorocentrum_minimum.AAC.1